MQEEISQMPRSQTWWWNLGKNFFEVFIELLWTTTQIPKVSI